MDCEAFDRVLLDSLYGELDELTEATARRHAQRCSRCAALNGRLRATHEIGVLPIEPTPVRLKERIVRAERSVHASLTVRQRFGRMISILAGYAMRPQLGMAALLLLMIGSSLLFLRVKPEDERGTVTERGVPESDHEPTLSTRPRGEVEAKVRSAAERQGPADDQSPNLAPSTRLRAEDPEAEPDSRSATESEERYEAALKAYRAGRYRKARGLFDAIATTPGPRSARAALYAARSARGAGGCELAVSLFDAVGTRFPASDSAREASWDAAECYRKLGRLAEARERYETLVNVPIFTLRAKTALGKIEKSAAPAEGGAPEGAVDGGFREGGVDTQGDAGGAEAAQGEK